MMEDERNGRMLGRKAGGQRMGLEGGCAIAEAESCAGRFCHAGAVAAALVVFVAAAAGAPATAQADGVRFAGTTTMPGVCSPAPLPGCKDTAEMRSALHIKDNPNDKIDFMRWTWLSGGHTSMDEFVAPTEPNAAYAICIYDAGVRPQPVSEAFIPTGGTCGKKSKPCWKQQQNKGFMYKDKAGVPDGVQMLQVAAGYDGQSRVKLKARGFNMQMPELPLAGPVTIQLMIDDGAYVRCFETVFTKGGMRANDTNEFKARGPGER